MTEQEERDMLGMPIAHRVREFATGATRDTDAGKLDYDGFLSPAVLRRYAEYMHRHRLQSDGKMRDSANWQKGMPRAQYIKSMWRHFIDVWTMAHALEVQRPAEEEALCALLFNVMGYLHETIKAWDAGLGPILDPDTAP
jgi:hypothetical protein